MRRFWISYLAVFWAMPAQADMLCEGPTHGAHIAYEAQDINRYLDLPDADALRVTWPIDQEHMERIAHSAEATPLVKAYCSIGLFEMIVEWHVTLADDSVAAQRTRAVYLWRPEGDGTPAGWQLETLAQRYICARGTAADNKTCL